MRSAQGGFEQVSLFDFQLWQSSNIFVLHTDAPAYHSREQQKALKRAKSYSERVSSFYYHIHKSISHFMYSFKSYLRRHIIQGKRRECYVQRSRRLRIGIPICFLAVVEFKYFCLTYRCASISFQRIAEGSNVYTIFIDYRGQGRVFLFS